MFIEKEYLDKWFQKVMERFDRLENSMIKPPEKERQRFDGELLLDNQDLCIMLNHCSVIAVWVGFRSSELTKRLIIYSQKWKNLLKTILKKTHKHRYKVSPLLTTSFKPHS
jgi:hypothetical protein